MSMATPCCIPILHSPAHCTPGKSVKSVKNSHTHTGCTMDSPQPPPPYFLAGKAASVSRSHASNHASCCPGRYFRPGTSPHRNHAAASRSRPHNTAIHTWTDFSTKRGREHQSKQIDEKNGEGRTFAPSCHSMMPSPVIHPLSNVPRNLARLCASSVPNKTMPSPCG